MRKFILLAALAGTFILPGKASAHLYHVTLTSGHDTWAVNTTTSLHVFAYCGNDRVRTGTGADVLEGGCGDDILEGWAGNDYLSGGIGADILVGGDGYDICEGNSGVDQYLGCEVRR